MVNIIQGSIKTFTVLVTKSDGRPFPLTGVAEITTCLKNTDGTELMLSLTNGDITVVDAPTGEISIALTDTETAALLPTDGDTLEIGFDFGSGPHKMQIPSAYAVIETIC